MGIPVMDLYEDIERTHDKGRILSNGYPYLGKNATTLKDHKGMNRFGNDLASDAVEYYGRN